jgi:hypothetical protein
MNYKPRVVTCSLSLLTAALIGVPAPIRAQEKKPNIVVIMGDDIDAIVPIIVENGL